MDNIKRAETSWRSKVSRDVLLDRATLLKKIRLFFDQRDILEVETPILARAPSTHHNVREIATEYRNEASGTYVYYLQTSPESLMKRLLASGSSSIFQITQAFRWDSPDRTHNVEFTILEWYEVGATYIDVMKTMDQLLFDVGMIEPAERITFHDAFYSYTNIDPFECQREELIKLLKTRMPRYGDGAALHNEDLSSLISKVMNEFVEPNLGVKGPVHLYDFPPGDPCLSHIRNDTVPVAERFETFVNGIEIAHGCTECIDAHEVEQRLIEEQAVRQHAGGLPDCPLDQPLLDALQAGLPACSGVAVGLDRLQMILSKRSDIGEVLAFPTMHA